MPRTLQNTPGCLSYVHPRLAFILAFNLYRSRWTYLLLGLSGFLFVLIIPVIVADSRRPLIVENQGLWISISFGLGTLLFYAMYRLLVYDADEPLRDQSRYFAEGLVPPLSDEQRDALLLDAHTVIEIRGWTETLEYWPVQRRLTDAGVSHFTSKFFDVEGPNVYMARLDKDCKVLSEEGFEEVSDYLLWGKMHSHGFAVIGRGRAKSAPQAMFDRLAELTNEPVAYVRACLSTKDGRPPQLLWAFDLWRCIFLARNAYMAGLISETKAWSTILLAAQRTFAIFPTRKAYYRNLLLGHAYSLNHYGQVQAVAKVIEQFETSEYPIRTLAWPTRPPGLKLPGYYLNGLAEAGRETESAAESATATASLE